MRSANIGPPFKLLMAPDADQVRYMKEDLEAWLVANKTGLPEVATSLGKK